MYYSSSKGTLLKMCLFAFLAGLLGIVVGLVLGIIVSLISYVLMSLSPDVGFDEGYQNLYMISTSLGMKGMVNGAAIGAVLGAVFGLKKRSSGMMMGGCGCCMSGKCGEECKCCDDHGNCMSAEKMGGCCREEMPMKGEKSSK